MPDPIELFLGLYEQATRSCPEPDAMVLSTVEPDGRPSGRYVLLKGVDQRGFVFYTNLGSRKARALAANPNASLCFYWPSIDKQVRIEGTVEPTTDAEADSYFATRPRESQIGAWASDQSAVLESSAILDERVAAIRERFGEGVVARPPFWSGFRVVPTAIEFWTRDEARLHRRERFDRTGAQWTRSLLYP
jgi:pyridoxamine 5'-phosphate oxidase